MDIDTRNREELKAYFTKNAVPTEANFAELIDGMITHADDGIAKMEGNPLAIQAEGDTQKLIDFYQEFSNENPSWSIGQNPYTDPEDPETAVSGLNISDSAGNTRLFIDQSTGTLGIGTLQPSEALEVNGNIKASGILKIEGTDDSYFTGSLGVGTTDPAEKLEVDGNLKASGVLKAEGTGDSYVTGSLGIGMTDPGEKLEVDGNLKASGVLKMEGTGDSYFTGSLGIDTDSPSQKLDVRGNAYLYDGSSTNVDIKSDTGETKIWAHSDGKSYFQTQGDLHFDAIGTTSSTPRLYIESTGNIGIGTDSPGANLHISSGTSGDAILLIEADTDNNDESDNPLIQLRQDGGTIGVDMGFDNDNFGANIFGIRRRYSGTDYWDTFTIDTSSGSVGIGTNSPDTGFALEVNGNMKADKYVVQDGTNGTSGKGIYMWTATDTNWGIYMGQSGSSRSLANKTACEGDDFTSHAVRFRVYNNATTGFIFENSGEERLLSINGDTGNTSITGTLKVGGNISLEDHELQNVKALQLKDWDDDTGGTDSKYRLLARDGAFMFHNGGVVVGSYGNNTWSDLSDGYLIVENRVGIGTTGPSAPLQVTAGSDTSPASNGLYVYNSSNSSKQHAIICARVAGSSAGDPFISWDISGEYGWSMGIDNDDSNKLKIARSWSSLTTNTAMTIDTSGNVGVGRTDPGYALDVATTVRTNTLLFNNLEQSNANDVSGEMYFDENYSGDFSAITGGDGGGLAIKTEDGWGAVIATNNMEWITPVFNGGTFNGNVSLEDNQLQNVKALQLKDWDDDTGGSDDKYRLLARDGAFQFYNGGVVVGNYNNSTWSDLSDGYLIVENVVGIGTTSPASGYALDVGDGLMSCNGIVVNSTDNSSLSSHIEEDGAFYRYSGQVYITVDDNLYVRDMNNDIRFHFNTNNGFAYQSSGYTLWMVYSDSRLKKNIEDFSDGLSQLRQIKPKRFQYTGDGGMQQDQEQVGIIAQDIQEVLPYTVFNNPARLKETDEENTDLLMFDPSVLTYVLINAVKELDQKVKTLEDTVEKLTQQLKTE